jgi:8-oxo-dGTP pyrophosphatase MutT (NUDIX family)
MAVPLRPAATVVLLREGPEGPEVWLMERNRKVGFMGAAWVFPGGRVDDGDAALPARFDRPDDIPRAFRAAAARELDEEAGVRLGDASEYHLDSLVPYAHWITPEIEPRRYDTWFFCAALPPGTEAKIDGEEAVAGAWLRPVDALARHHAGGLPLAPPTLRTLSELAAFDSVAGILEAPRRTPPICPRFAVERDGALVTAGVDPTADDTIWVLLPGDPAYPADEAVAPPTRFPFALGRWWAR